MRPFDILRSDPNCWLYIPGRDKSPIGEHKTMRFGRSRLITLTKKTQDILLRRITDFGSKEYVFKPDDAVKEMRARRAKRRHTPLSCGNRPGSNCRLEPQRSPGKRYTSYSLRTACRRGCIKARVSIFTPYDLRRSTATRVKAMLDKGSASVLLGHVNTDTTDIYLLDEVKEAMNVAKRLAARI